jgi:hypothetical protein
MTLPLGDFELVFCFLEALLDIFDVVEAGTL